MKKISSKKAAQATKVASLFSKKKGAMEMSVGTIVTIVLLMAVLVLGLTLTRNIFTSSSESVDAIDTQVKTEINNLFSDSGKKLVVGLGSQNTAKVKQGTENFGILFGFSPDDPTSWGNDKNNCKYDINPVDQPNYCIQKGWSGVKNYIQTGSNDVSFDEVEGINGYALVKINIPEETPICLQRFEIIVSCYKYPLETTKSYFDLEVIKKGLF